jgi:hypothetical protein
VKRLKDFSGLASAARDASRIHTGDLTDSPIQVLQAFVCKHNMTAVHRVVTELIRFVNVDDTKGARTTDGCCQRPVVSQPYVFF